MSPTARTVIALLGFGVLALSALRAEEPPAANPKRANAKARAEAAAKVYKGILLRKQVDPSAPSDPEVLSRWSRRWMEAEQELSEKKEGRIAAAEAHLERMKKVETAYKQLLENKAISPVEGAAAEFFRLEAERDLAQLKDK
jgi:hypothetical protein